MTAECKAECAVDGVTTGCTPCRAVMEDKINYAFNSAGGVGLFFAFTEVSQVNKLNFSCTVLTKTNQFIIMI